MEGKINIFIKYIATLILKIFKKEVSKQNIQETIQFLKFCIVGVSNTILSYLINILVLFFLGTFNISWDYIVANIAAFVLSVLWSFYWNNRYVFKEEKGTKRVVWKTLIKTYVAYSFSGIILSNVLSYLWNSVLGISKYISPLINLIVSVPLNYLINKLWTFSD